MTVVPEPELLFPRRAETDSRPTDLPGRYLTNGAFLYRVVRLVAGTSDTVVELEDCYGLDVVRVAVTELDARGLRVVIPAQSHL